MLTEPQLKKLAEIIQSYLRYNINTYPIRHDNLEKFAEELEKLIAEEGKKWIVEKIEKLKGWSTCIHHNELRFNCSLCCERNVYNQTLDLIIKKLMKKEEDEDLQD